MALLTISEEEWQVAEQYFSEHPAAVKFDRKLKGSDHSFIRVKVGEEYQIYALATKHCQSEEKHAQLGEGGFGKVKVAQDREGNSYAVKIGKRESKKMDPDETANVVLMQELQELKGYAFRKRQEKYNKTDEKYKMYKILEYHAGTELFQHIEASGLTETEKYLLAFSLCSTLEALHEKKVIHGDVKPENFMRKEDGTLALIDLDFSLKANENGEVQLRRIRGTAGYMAPEIGSARLEDGEAARYSYSSDVYALGKLFEKNLKLDPFIWDGMTDYTAPAQVYMHQVSQHRPSLLEIKGRLAEKLYPMDLGQVDEKTREQIKQCREERIKREEEKLYKEIEHAQSLQSLASGIKKFPYDMIDEKGEKIDKEKLAKSIDDLANNPEVWKKIKDEKEDALWWVAKHIPNSQYGISKKVIHLVSTIEDDIHVKLKGVKNHEELSELIRQYPEEMYKVVFPDVQHKPTEEEIKETTSQLIKEVSNFFKDDNVEIIAKYKHGQLPVQFRGSVISQNKELGMIFIGLAKAHYARINWEVETKIKSAQSIEEFSKIIQDYPYKEIPKSSIKYFLEALNDNLEALHNKDYDSFDLYGIEDDFGIQKKIIELAQAKYQSLQPQPKEQEKRPSAILVATNKKSEFMRDKTNIQVEKTKRKPTQS